MAGEPVCKRLGKRTAFGGIAGGDAGLHLDHRFHDGVMFVDVALPGGEVGFLHPLVFLGEMRFGMAGEVIQVAGNRLVAGCQQGIHDIDELAMGVVHRRVAQQVGIGPREIRRGGHGGVSAEELSRENTITAPPAGAQMPARNGWLSFDSHCTIRPMNDYQRIAAVIRYIDEHRTGQPSLDELAAQAGLSPFHFHRLFSAWAGVTPKDFLQCLTLAHARQLLREGESVLDAAFAAGLSGPGRLHDLTVSLDAATPGEIKSGGQGWTLRAGFADSPFGDCLVAESPRGICHVSFLQDGSTRESALLALQAEWPHAVLHRDDAVAVNAVSTMFVPPHERRRGRSLRILVRGSLFQVRVWRALLAIPEGSLASYGGLAAGIGAPAAARAVGSAVAKNNIAWLIPCHRVIRETGVVGEYRWGSDRKRAMLAWEGARAQPAA